VLTLPPTLPTSLRMGRPVEDLTGTELACITFEVALAIAESGERRWHGPEADQE